MKAILVLIVLSTMFMSGCVLPPPPVIEPYGNNTVRITYLVNNVSRCNENAIWDMKNLNCEEYVQEGCSFQFHRCSRSIPVTKKECR